MNCYRRPLSKLAFVPAFVSLLGACAGTTPTALSRASDAGARVHDSSQGCQADQMSDASLVGKTEDDAVALLGGCPWRIAERDGQQFPGTMDFNPARRSLGIAAGKVVWVRRG